MKNRTKVGTLQKYIDARAGTVSKKRLYSGRSAPPNNEDGEGDGDKGKELRISYKKSQ